MALNSQLIIRQRVAAEDALGQPIESWQPVATMWGEIRHPSGLETIRADAQTSVVKASIKVRLRRGITAAMQALHGNTVYEIDAVLPDLVDRQHMFLVCRVVS